MHSHWPLTPVRVTLLLTIALGLGLALMPPDAAWAQTSPFGANASRVSLGRLLQAMEEQYTCRFLYRAHTIDGADMVQSLPEGATSAEAFWHLAITLRLHGLGFARVGGMGVDTYTVEPLEQLLQRSQAVVPDITQIPPDAPLATLVLRPAGGASLQLKYAIEEVVNRDYARVDLVGDALLVTDFRDGLTRARQLVQALDTDPAAEPDTFASFSVGEVDSGEALRALYELLAEEIQAKQVVLAEVEDGRIIARMASGVHPTVEAAVRAVAGE